MHRQRKLMKQMQTYLIIGHVHVSTCLHQTQHNVLVSIGASKVERRSPLILSKEEKRYENGKHQTSRDEELKKWRDEQQNVIKRDNRTR